MFCLSWTATRSVTKCHGIDSRRVEGASSRNCNRLYVVTVMHTMPCSFQIIQYLFKYLQVLSWLKWETQLWWKRLLLFSWIPVPFASSIPVCKRGCQSTYSINYSPYILEIIDSIYIGTYYGNTDNVHYPFPH